MRDGVRLAVLSSRLETIARKMANTLFRTARSGLINSARDLSCCILTADHELLAEAESLPSHVLVGPDIMARTMQAFHPELRRGDAFLHNSPYHGNSHAADHTILVPVHRRCRPPPLHDLRQGASGRHRQQRAHLLFRDRAGRL